MFDTIIQQRRKHWSDCLPEHQRIEHHEHRAPTDESVRLLREMEAAAERKLVDVLDVRSNQLSFTTFVSYCGPTNRTEIRIVYSLNGERHDFTIGDDDFAWMRRSSEERVRFLRDEIAKRIASGICVDLLHKNSQSLLRPANPKASQ